MNRPDYHDALQELCDVGQQRLMAMDYLAAERALVDAEELALARDDLDTLGRLYYPLQEARRQHRQLCGEGIVRLDVWADDPGDHLDPEAIVKKYPQGQLLVAGWADLSPAVEVRRLARERGLYLETFLGAVYPGPNGKRLVAICPFADQPLPPADTAWTDDRPLVSALPDRCLMFGQDQLPHGKKQGDAETFAATMGLWERLAQPHLDAANAMQSAPDRIAGFRRTIEVDSACEKAHQWLATTALDAARANRSAVDGGSSQAAVATP